MEQIKKNQQCNLYANMPLRDTIDTRIVLCAQIGNRTDDGTQLADR